MSDRNDARESDHVRSRPSSWGSVGRGRHAHEPAPPLAIGSHPRTDFTATSSLVSREELPQRVRASTEVDRRVAHGEIDRDGSWASTVGSSAVRPKAEPSLLREPSGHDELGIEPTLDGFSHGKRRF